MAGGGVSGQPENPLDTPLHGTHGFCDDKRYSTKTANKLPPNSDELKESCDIFNGGGEQHSS